jgi:hypothetical protein
VRKLGQRLDEVRISGLYASLGITYALLAHHLLSKRTQKEDTDYHSFGGLNMRLYAYRYPGGEAGMGLLNATSSFTGPIRGSIGISPRSCKPMHHYDGYSESKGLPYADPTILAI